MYSPINLPYSVNALEPYIDGETVMVHYGKHYMNYLNKLNELLSKYDFNFNLDKELIIPNINQFREEDREDILYNLERLIILTIIGLGKIYTHLSTILDIFLLLKRKAIA